MHRGTAPRPPPCAAVGAILEGLNVHHAPARDTPKVQIHLVCTYVVKQNGVVATCPRWALPGEELPLHVRIPKELTPEIKSARIRLDDSLEVRRVINMPGYAQDGQTLLIPSINRDSMADYDYFGVAVATLEPFKELKKEVPILVELERLDGTVQRVTEHVRIFRPLLRVGDTPEELVIRDGNGQALQLPIRLRYDGFGDVKMSVECTIQGRVVSSGSSMLDEVMRRVIREGVVVDDADRDSAVQISPEYVEQTVSDLKAELDNDEALRGMLERLKLDEESANLLLDLSSESKERFMTVIHKTVETHMAQIISDILSRNPSDNLQMESTSIRTKIRLPTTQVALKLSYEDRAGNRYDPLEWVVKIVDRRKSPSALDVEIPLTVTDVDDRGAFKNVGEMEIRSSK